MMTFALVAFLVKTEYYCCLFLTAGDQEAGNKLLASHVPRNIPRAKAIRMSTATTIPRLCPGFKFSPSAGIQ